MKKFNLILEIFLILFIFNLYSFEFWYFRILILIFFHVLVFESYEVREKIIEKKKEISINHIIKKDDIGIRRYFVYIKKFDVGCLSLHSCWNVDLGLTMFFY